MRMLSRIMGWLSGRSLPALKGAAAGDVVVQYSEVVELGNHVLVVSAKPGVSEIARHVIRRAPLTFLGLRGVPFLVGDCGMKPISRGVSMSTARGSEPRRQ